MRTLSIGRRFHHRLRRRSAKPSNDSESGTTTTRKSAQCEEANNREAPCIKIHHQQQSCHERETTRRSVSAHAKARNDTQAHRTMMKTIRSRHGPIGRHKGHIVDVQRTVSRMPNRHVHINSIRDRFRRGTRRSRDQSRSENPRTTHRRLIPCQNPVLDRTKDAGHETHNQGPMNLTSYLATIRNPTAHEPRVAA